MGEYEALQAKRDRYRWLAEARYHERWTPEAYADAVRVFAVTSGDDVGDWLVCCDIAVQANTEE